eukprot:TRINITY_DN38_c0_g1_i6.p1 TRINITY_DN38_c0_g1~~TRINITY_DN38_c0_g1_i6.p1  ORF type:complete len:216 (+),score=75.28 TRINITY_DN38_c0_g1_i6:200-847(+)
MQFLVLILSASLAYGAVAPAKREAEAEPGQGYSSGPQCHDKKDRQCHKTPKQTSRQECHEEYDVVVDTTYIEECQDIITTHCQETSQKIQHSSAVVGHDSKVVSHGYGSYGGYGIGKREAEAEAAAEPGQSYSTGPKCHDKKDRQCHKTPKQNSRKIPRKECKTIVDTTYIEDCQDIITTHCQETHQKVSHSSAVVGHDSKVVSHGYGSYGGYGY